MIVGTIVGTIAIIVVTIVIGLVADKKVDVLPRPEKLANGNTRAPIRGRGAKPSSGYAAGETAATAIRAGAAQQAKLQASQRCAGCRAALEVCGDDRVRYQDHELIVIQFVCPSCGKKRSLYVDPIA